MKAWILAGMVGTVGGCSGVATQSVGDLSTGGSTTSGGISSGGATETASSGGASSGGTAGGTSTTSSGGRDARPPSRCDLEPTFEDQYEVVSRYYLDEPGGAALINEVDVPLTNSSVPSPATAHAVQRVTGACGRALRFLGNDSRLELPPVGDFARGIALDLWVRPARLVAMEPELDSDGKPLPFVQHLIGDGESGLRSFWLFLEDGVPVFSISDNGWRELLRADRALALNEWQHLRVTYDTDFGSVQLDGAEVATLELSSPVPSSFNTIYVGSTLTQLGRPSYAFAGDLDELTILAKR